MRFIRLFFIRFSIFIVRCHCRHSTISICGDGSFCTWLIFFHSSTFLSRKYSHHLEKIVLTMQAICIYVWVQEIPISWRLPLPLVFSIENNCDWVFQSCDSNRNKIYKLSHLRLWLLNATHGNKKKRTKHERKETYDKRDCYRLNVVNNLQHCTIDLLFTWILNLESVHRITHIYCSINGVSSIRALKFIYDFVADKFFD